MSEQAQADAQDLLWVRQVQQHDDRAAFACLLRRHQGAVRALLRRLTRGDAGTADDLAQECFLRAYQAMKDFRGASRVRTWLVRIAYNLFLQQQRSASAQMLAQAQSLEDGPAPPELAGGDDLGRQVALGLDLQRALSRLNEPERLAILHCYAAELSHAEAAEVLGWPLGTVKTHVLRGRAKLRVALAGWQPDAKNSEQEAA